MTGLAHDPRRLARLRVMLVTDTTPRTRPLREAVRAALEGGATAVQLRAPGMAAGELHRIARELRPLTLDAEALLLVNDRIDVAIAARADGVHLKRASLPPSAARELLGPDALIGVSTHSEAEVADAFEGGADYVLYGPVFETPSKAGIFDPRGPEDYARVAAAAPGPVLALGGVSRETLPRLASGPLPGVAVIRAILDAEDPAAAARELRWAVEAAGRRV